MVEKRGLLSRGSYLKRWLIIIDCSRVNVAVQRLIAESTMISPSPRGWQRELAGQSRAELGRINLRLK